MLALALAAGLALPLLELGGYAPGARDPAALDTAEQWVHQRRTEWERRLDRLGDFLARTAPGASPSRVTGDADGDERPHE